MKPPRSDYARPESSEESNAPRRHRPSVQGSVTAGMDGPAEQRELLRVVYGSSGGLEAGADMAGDQLDLLRGECLPGHLQGGAEHAAGKDRDAVHEELAQPRDRRPRLGRGPVAVVASTNNIAVSNGRMIALCGVKDLVVVETADAILVCHRDAVQNIKQIVPQLPKELL